MKMNHKEGLIQWFVTMYLQYWLFVVVPHLSSVFKDPI